jgi:membrane-anchored glycerophosphoryl diester phosphodiesterase (GDPDase)
MVLIKVMKRKDASSVFVAVVLAFIIMQLLSQLTMPLANLITSGSGTPYYTQNADAVGSYLHPLAWAVLQIALFEVLGMLYVGVMQLVRQPKKRK